MTTTTPAPRRPLVGVLYALAGLLILTEVLFAWLDPSMSSQWLVILTDGAMTLAFLFVAVGSATPHLTRVLFSVAAIGWALSVIGAVGWANNGSDVLSSVGGFGTITVVLALIGSLGGGILAFAQHVFGQVANLVFLIAMIVTAVLLADNLYPVLPALVAEITNVLFGIALLVAGIVIAVRTTRDHSPA
jgi:hypothetical protein